MNDEIQQRLITFLAVRIAFGISHAVVNRFIDIPEPGGIKDDVLESVLKGGTTAVSTLLASMIVRRAFSRW